MVAFLSNHWKTCLYILACTSFSDDDPDAELSLTAGLRGVDDLVVVHDPGGDPGVGDLLVGHARGVALDHLAHVERLFHEAEQRPVALVLIEHQLGAYLLDALGLGPGEGVSQVLDAGRVGRGGEADAAVLGVAHGGSDEDRLDRRRQQLVEEEARGAHAVDDGVAVEAVHDGRGAVQQSARGEDGGVRVGVPLMAVGVDQPRHQEAPFGIDDLGVVADGVGNVADGRDPLSLDGDAFSLDGAGVDVDHAAARDDRVGGLVAHCHVDQRFPLQLHRYPPLPHSRGGTVVGLGGPFKARPRWVRSRG